MNIEEQKKQALWLMITGGVLFLIGLYLILS